MKKAIVLGVGDLVLDVPDMDKYFEPSREILKKGDVVIGHVEVPHTTRGTWSNGEASSSPPSDPKNLDVLTDAGFNVATLAGNHIFDQGYFGVMDTVNRLKELGLKTTGAGENLEEARKPAIIETKDQKFAVLQYNTVGPRESWAAPLKAGGAFVMVATSYFCDKAEPGGAPTAIYTVAEPNSLNLMVNDIKKAKDEGYCVIVMYHMGRLNSPDILQYQFEITRKAIDSGAEMVLCNHAHTMLGIEMYKGKPIYFGLGNYVTLTTAFDKSSPNAPQFAFRPWTWQGTSPYWKPFERIHSVPPIPNYPFGHESRHTMIAKGVFENGKIVEASFIPCYIDGIGAPVPVNREGLGKEVLTHLLGLNKTEKLDANFKWNEDGTEVIITD